VLYFNGKLMQPGIMSFFLFTDPDISPENADSYTQLTRGTSELVSVALHLSNATSSSEPYLFLV
jgi:hypothetical protein